MLEVKPLSLLPTPGMRVEITAVDTAKHIAHKFVEHGETLRDLVVEFDSYCRHAPVCFNARLTVDCQTAAVWIV
jgi:hypothetical protein